MKIKRMPCIALLIAVNTIHAQQDGRWRIAAQSLTETVYIDTTSIVRNKESTSVWTKQTQLLPDSARSETLETTVQNWAISCSRREFSLRGSTDYSKSGTVLDKTRAQSDFISIPPESLIEVIFDATCRNKWRKTLGEAFREEFDSEILKLWTETLQAACPAKKILRQEIVNAIAKLPDNLKALLVDVEVDKLCKAN